MSPKQSHQLITGVSFGATSGIITAIGMIIGLNSATSSKLAVAAGIIVMAIANGFADAAGLHVSEESEVEWEKVKHTQKEIWFTTFFTFLSVCGSSLTFAVPILIFPLKMAVIISVGWGILLLIILNCYIASIRKENPAHLISEHIFLALFVIFVSYWAGILVARFIK